MPLGIEQILHSLPEVNIRRIFGAGRGQGLRFAAAQRFFPLLPADPVMGIFQGHEQGIVRQPERVFRQKIGVIRRGRCQQAGTSFVQHHITLLVQRSVIDTARGAFPVDRFIFFRLEEARFGQQVQVNKIRIARKGRKRLVRAVAIAGGANRKDLPVSLTGFD